MSTTSQAGHAKRFVCPICKKNFSTKSTKENHVILMHQNAGRFRCGHCSKTFQCRQAFENHERTHTGEKPFECSVCHRQFSTKRLRNEHELMMHQNAGRHRCRHCTKTFENRLQWEVHERSHTGEKPYECPICKKKFSSNQFKENHLIVVHQNAGRHKCGYCPRTFQIKGDKEIHERSHTGEKPFDCPICLKSFTTAKTKRSHVILVHENAGRLRCQHCNKTYQDKRHLEAHEITHTGEKPFACAACPKKFSRKNALRNHMLLVHENGGRLKCDHCERRFQTKQALEVHKTTHTEERPFACALCEKQFKSKLQLKNHHSSQHAEKKFKCDRCSKAFGTNANLTRHHLSHSEGSFQCELCPKVFKYAQLLRIHQRNSHGEKKFSCDKCSKAFGSRGPLNNHLRRVHSGNRLKRHLPGHSTIQREALGESHLTRAEDQNELEVEPDGTSCSSVGAAYVDADESDESSSEGSDESGSEVQDSEDEQSESDQESDQEEEADGVLDEMPNKRVKTERWAADGEVDSFDAPISGSQRQTIKREPGSDGQTGSDVSIATTAHKPRKPSQSTISMVTLSSDDESDQENDLLAQSNAVSSSNLKLVYDVEYQPPN